MCGRAAAVAAEDALSPEEGGAPVDPSARPGDDPRAGLPADERGLLEAFDRLRPQGTLRWNFDDTVRRLTEPPEVHGRAAGWGGLPADLWERGRSTKASERVLGDVVNAVAQNLSEYTDRALDEERQLATDAVAELRAAVRDAVRFLSARVDRFESRVDPLGMQAAELELPTFDRSMWVDSAAGWTAGRSDLPALIGELGDDVLLSALAASGATVEGVDPRGPVAWAVHAGTGTGRINIALAEVIDHLRTLPTASRGCVVLAGCVDRADLAGKVDLVDEALRVVAPGGTLVVLVADQVAWDAALDPVVGDLLPGRPLHPETWLAVLAHRGAVEAAWLPPVTGDVHAVMCEVGR